MIGPSGGCRPPGTPHRADDASTSAATDPAADLEERLDAGVLVARAGEEGLARDRALFEAWPDPAFVTDRRGLVRHVNRAALELLDGGDRAVRPWGKPLAVYVALADRRAFRTALDRALDGPVSLRAGLGPPGIGARVADVRVVPLPGGDVLWSARTDDDVMT